MTTNFELEAPSIPMEFERFNLCQGWDGDQRCGDEVSKGVELCPSCQRIEQARLDREAWKRDGEDGELVSYPSLTSPEEHLR